MTTDNGRHIIEPQSGLVPDGSREIKVACDGNSARIASISETGSVHSPQSVVEAGGTYWWSAGIVDTQINGYTGVDYSAPGLTPAAVATVVRALDLTGTTHHVPTIITNSHKMICANLESLVEACRSDGQIHDGIIGLHVEGPYISSEDGPRGAHDARFVRDPDIGEIREWIAAADGRLRIVTLAPERKGAVAAIEFLRSEGVVAAIGHTAANETEIERAIDAGASHSTHLGNGSHAALPRLQNYLWTQLAHDELSAGVIADGFHLPAAVLKTIVRAKGAQRIVAVSDASPVAGLAPGRHHWGDKAIEVDQHGRVGLAGTPFLAGAGHLLDRGVVRLLADTDLDLAGALATCTTNALASVGRGPRMDPLASLGVGDAPASLIRFRVTQARLEVTTVIRNGRVVLAKEILS